MNIVRKIKIDKLFPILTEREKEIVKFIEASISNLDSYTHKDLKESIFYFKNNNFVLEYLPKVKLMYVRYDNLISVLENKYNLYDLEATSLILNLLQHRLKMSKDKLNLVIYENNSESRNYIEKIESMQHNTHFMNKIEIKRGVN